MKFYFPWCCGAGFLTGEDIEISLLFDEGPLQREKPEARFGFAFFWQETEADPIGVGKPGVKVLYTSKEGQRLCARVAKINDLGLEKIAQAGRVWGSYWTPDPLSVAVHGDWPHQEGGTWFGGTPNLRKCCSPSTTEALADLKKNPQPVLAIYKEAWRLLPALPGPVNRWIANAAGDLADMGFKRVFSFVNANTAAYLEVLLRLPDGETWEKEEPGEPSEASSAAA